MISSIGRWNVVFLEFDKFFFVTDIFFAVGMFSKLAGRNWVDFFNVKDPYLFLNPDC
jgi:hypothetical protein